jgi:hypothetical protein
MPNSGNFNPEWGYLAPRPGFVRTARMVVLAGVIGTVGGIAVAAALIERPASEDLSVAARTMAPSSGPETPPVASNAAVASAELLDTGARRDAAPRPPAQLAKNPPELKDIAAAESHSAATVQSPTGLAGLAEAPAMRDDAADAPPAAIPVASARRPNKTQPANVAALAETPALTNGAAEAPKATTTSPAPKRASKIHESANAVALAESPALRDDASETLSDEAPAAAPKRQSKRMQVVHARVASAEPNFRGRDNGPFDLLRTLFGGKPLFNQVR